MPEQATTTTTRPTRQRPSRAGAAPKTATAAAAPSKAKAAPKAEPEQASTEVTRFTVALEHVGSTKSFEKFAFPDSYKGVVVGNVYAPIGTQEVKVLVIGAGDAGDDE